MLEFVVYFLLICGIIWLGITIVERMRKQQAENERWLLEMEIKELERQEQAAYIAAEAEKFAEKHPYPGFGEVITKKTLESPPAQKKTFGTRAVPGQTIKVSERKLIREQHSDCYCEDDCVPLITPMDILAAEVILDAVTHRPDYFDGGAMVSSYDPSSRGVFGGGGGQFDGGGAADTYEEPKQTYTAPEPDPPSYSEPDSSSSWTSDDDT